MLINVKYAPCSIMMGAPTEEWGEPTSPGSMFYQNSTQEVLNNEPIKNMKKVNASIIHVGNTILAAAVVTIINENLCLLDNQLT